MRNLKEDTGREIKRYSDVYSDERRNQGWWYFTTHGVQPGSVPKDVNILEVRDTPNGTYFRVDAILNTSELKYYDIKERVPKEEESLKEDASMDSAQRLEDDGWVVLSHGVRGGDNNFYWLARRMNKERGKADWKAINDKTGEVIDITYEQALEREPIGVSSGVSKLSKKLGKVLLPQKINIRESLNKYDLRTDNKYDLRNLYDACIMTDEEKRIIAEMIAKNTRANVLYEALMNKFEGKELKESKENLTLLYKNMGGSIWKSTGKSGERELHIIDDKKGKCVKVLDGSKYTKKDYDNLIRQYVGGSKNESLEEDANDMLRQKAEPLANALDELTDREDGFYITYSIGMDDNGTVTGGVDFELFKSSRTEDEARAEIERVFDENGFELDRRYKTNPGKTLLGRTHYQIIEKEK